MKQKRLVLDVEPEFHFIVLDYCRRGGRTVKGMLRLAVEGYMRQNPVPTEAGYDEYEKR